MKHGGDMGEATARYGAGDPPWLDLSTGINPHAWPVPGRLRAIGWTRLPAARDVAALEAAARRAYRVPDDLAIVAAPGTQALIQWLPRLAPPGPVAIAGPTYSEHDRAWRAAGRAVVSWPGDGHRVLVNPNNPDGRLLPPGDVADVAGHEGWTVVDESFADVTPGSSVVETIGDKPLIVLRSFGKFYGLAGLRLGFAVAPPAIAARIAEALGPWAVSAPALAVGQAALADESWAERMRARLAAEAGRLDAVLVRAGLAVVGGTSLFRLVRDGRAEAIGEALARRHIWVRRFGWDRDLLRFGLPPDGAARARLAAALADVVA